MTALYKPLNSLSLWLDSIFWFSTDRTKIFLIILIKYSQQFIFFIFYLFLFNVFLNLQWINCIIIHPLLSIHRSIHILAAVSFWDQPAALWWEVGYNLGTLPAHYRAKIGGQNNHSHTHLHAKGQPLLAIYLSDKSMSLNCRSTWRDHAYLTLSPRSPGDSNH